MPNDLVIRNGFLSIDNSTVVGSLTVNGSIIGDGSQLTGITTPISQTDIIYIDSVNGVDDLTANRGQINKPYATVEYALSSTTNTGTVTGTTTTGNNTITSVNDTTNIKVGQYITGAGIPFNTTVISKTSNSITLSTTATANGSGITLTWWTLKLLRLNGNFTATSNWFKQGFYFDSNPSVTVQWGAFSLYEVPSLSVIPYINNGEFNYYGTTSTSRWFYTAASLQTSDSIFIFKFNTVTSNVTSNLITLGLQTNYFNGTFKFEGKILNARLGSLCYVGYSTQNIYFDVLYSYGLLGGIYYSFFNGIGIWKGTIQTPSSVYAINGSGVGYVNFIDGNIIGSVSYSGGRKALFTSTISSATNCSISNVEMYGNLPDSGILNGNVDFYGFHTSYLYVDSGYNRIYRQPQWGIVTRNSAIAEINSDMSSLYNLQVQNTSKMIINTNATAGGVTIASGSKLIVNGELRSPDMTINGELENNGDIFITSTSITISSTGLLRNYKRLISTVASTTIPLIIKNGGNLYLYPSSYIKVANGKGPLKCSANTSASKNIYLFNAITNCDGSTYGLLIPFDGTSFAANDLVGGILYENTNY